MNDRITQRLSVWQRYRRNGVRQTKSLLSSSADVISDWVFYLNVKDDPALDDKYGLYMFIFACVSSVMLVVLASSFLVSSMSTQTKRSATTKFAPFGTILKMLLGLEILVEDIPQFVLGALVRNDTGSISPYLVFTWTTSAFNFSLNLLDMIEIEDEELATEETSDGGDGQGEYDNDVDGEAADGGNAQLY